MKCISMKRTSNVHWHRRIPHGVPLLRLKPARKANRHPKRRQEDVDQVLNESGPEGVL